MPVPAIYIGCDLRTVRSDGMAHLVRGLAVGMFVAGAGYLDQGNLQKRHYWPVLLVAMPVFLALFMDVGPFRESGLLLSGLVVLWVAKCLRPVLWPSEPTPAHSAEELYAGIVLVDWLAACPAASLTGPFNQVSRQISVAFIALFVLAVLFQRVTRER